VMSDSESSIGKVTGKAVPILIRVATDRGAVVL
jgi:hypothetical protein